jgi:dGTPase
MALPLYARFGSDKDDDGEPFRSAVAKDRDRIIHSSALRRLQGKSQVMGPQTSDYFRTRLTHSLECAQVGRSIAARVPEAPWEPVVRQFADLADVVEAACLAHDLGHPPFGHNGEDALRESMMERLHKRFEGNAQSFRIVSNLEPKVFRQVSAGNDRWVGLDLCRATLRAILKYPWDETSDLVDPDHPKFSVYDDAQDRETFAWIWGDEKPGKTLATRIMDVSDDIAYAAHDFEDGVWSEMIPLFDLIAADEAAVAKLHRKVSDKHPTRDLDDVSVALRDLFADAMSIAGFSAQQRRWAVRPFERKRENVAYLKRLTAALIGMFIDSVASNKLFQEPDPDVRFKIDLLTGCAWVWMIERSDLMTRQYGQRRIIEELFDGYCDDLQTLPRREELEEIEGLPKSRREEATVRLVCDHIAGMTDQYALRAHREMYRGESPFEIRYTY